ncbi:MAG: hypothetical protein II169_09280 [Lachnospiraceae bacterium]|nr:hypothetical protein [Lachnospiraceae bacterium]
MKKGISVLLIAFLSLSLTGCGLIPSLYSMTDEEEDQIVSYASKVVSKYNTLQGDGITRVYSSDYEKEEDKTEETTDDIAEEEPTSQGETDVVEDTTKYVTLDAALEQPGISFSYQGLNVSSSYVEGDYLSLTPDKGYDYLIMQFQLTNTNAEETMIDILSKHPSFTVTVDGATVAKNEQTILLMDLATYQSTIEAGGTANAVLLFQVPTGSASSESSVALQVKVGGADYDISL